MSNPTELRGLEALQEVKPWEDRESLYETEVFSQIERMEAEIADLRYVIRAQRARTNEWEARHADMVKRNALLRERPDLPVDRIPAHAEMVRLQEENARLRAQPEGEAPQAEPAPILSLEDCPEDDQQWAKVDPAVAFHLIERHAEDWADAGRMMLQWHNAMSRAAQLDGGQEGSAA